MLVVSKRKNAFLTEEEKAAAVERKKRKKLSIQKKQIDVCLLSLKVVSLWQHGMFMPDRQFGPKNCKQIVQFLQTTYEKYRHVAAAKSFVYRAIDRHKKLADSPHLNPHRDRRGENRRSPKRHDPRTVELCDELLSEPNATSKTVRRTLTQNYNITISLATVQRIRLDLGFVWQKPWHTDILTPAQKKKRVIFCADLLLLNEQELLQVISGWLWTDEKWWDIVGPSPGQYVKGRCKAEAKMANQVCFCL